MSLDKKQSRIEIKGGIMYVNYTRAIVITLPIAKKMVEGRIKFQQQQGYDSIPIVYNINVKYANKAARVYLSLEGIKGVSASAFIVNTMAAKTLLKFYLLVEKPDIPIRMFEDEETAVDWIKEFVGKRILATER